jgi:hypothetical protein
MKITNQTINMKLIYILVIISLFAACTKDPTGSSGCPPAKNIYFRFTDTFATSLVDVYKQGDTLKLKHNSGTIYYFIAQKPDSGFAFEKPVTGGYCDGDNYYLQYYQIVLKPTVTSLTKFVIKVYYTQENLKRFRIEFNDGYYELTPGFFPPPPSNLYINNFNSNGLAYNNVGRIPYNYEYTDTASLYYNRAAGIIKVIKKNGEYFELEP